MPLPECGLLLGRRCKLLHSEKRTQSNKTRQENIRVFYVRTDLCTSTSPSGSLIQLTSWPGLVSITGLWPCLDVPPKPSMVTGGAISAVAGSRVYDLGLRVHDYYINPLTGVELP